MDFRLSDEQRAVRAGARELMARLWPPERLREAADRPVPSLDRGAWRELGAAGCFGALDLPEAVLLFEEAGRALLPGPLVAQHLAASGGDERAAAGETVVTAVGGDGLVEWYDAADLVLPSYGGPAGWNAVAEDGGQADGGPSGGRPSGGGPEDGGLADGGPAGGGPAGGGPSGRWRGAVRPLRSVDPLTPLHIAVVDEAGTCGTDAVLLTAAQQTGSAARTLELAVQHARTRRQFGRPIGGFQAVKHLCADMLVRTELARTAVLAAAVTGDPAETAAAKLLADEAACVGARDCLQVFGGTGFTWEAEVHLHLKRAWVLGRRCGTAEEHEEALAERLLHGAVQ